MKGGAPLPSPQGELSTGPARPAAPGPSGHTGHIKHLLHGSAFVLNWQQWSMQSIISHLYYLIFQLKNKFY